MRENYIVENDLSIIIERRLEKNVMGGTMTVNTWANMSLKGSVLLGCL